MKNIFNADQRAIQRRTRCRIGMAFTQCVCRVADTRNAAGALGGPSLTIAFVLTTWAVLLARCTTRRA